MVDSLIVVKEGKSTFLIDCHAIFGIVSAQQCTLVKFWFLKNAILGLDFLHKFCRIMKEVIDILLTFLFTAIDKQISHE